MIGFKKINDITTEDCCNNLIAIISIFIDNPQFQGQTKNKLSNKEVVKKVESALKDRLEVWLSQNINISKMLLDSI